MQKIDAVNSQNLTLNQQEAKMVNLFGAYFFVKNF
jgi:hypothetical protein